MDGNVTRLRILLQLGEHGPAEHVGQEDVERHRGRPELTGERERIGAARRHEHLQAIVVGEIDEDPRVVRVVLHDEERGLRSLERRAIVWQHLHGSIWKPDGISPWKWA